VILKKDLSVTDKPQFSSELSRELSLFHITMMGLGMMIGAGVFLGTGRSIAIVGPGVGVKFDLDQFLEENTERIALGRERVTTKAVASRKVVSAILAEIEDEAQAYDLVVMGCTREPIIRRMTGRPVPETVAGMCRKPLVMVNASGGIRSWVKRWI
jgi:hypothetical protein